MSCNWELFELRLRVWIKANKYPQRGYFGNGMMLWDVRLEHQFNLGIPAFKPDSKGNCNFKSVFTALAGIKKIPFTCPASNENRSPFGRLQVAQRNKEVLPAAFLFLHRRDQSDISSETTGIGILLEGVTVLFTKAQPVFHADLSGNSASTVNF
jgi:hypothetical protein